MLLLLLLLLFLLFLQGRSHFKDNETVLLLLLLLLLLFWKSSHFKDHETVRQISGRRHLPDQQIVEVEEVVEGIADDLQSQSR